MPLLLLVTYAISTNTSINVLISGLTHHLCQDVPRVSHSYLMPTVILSLLHPSQITFRFVPNFVYTEGTWEGDLIMGLEVVMIN